MALISILKAGTHIPPHHGMINTRLICHIPLVVPKGCRLRVGAETREVVEGRAMIFDDSFEHEAWNDGDAVRGVDREWLRELYSFAVQPSLAFYFDVPLAEAITRIRGGRSQLKYYEAGLDLGLASDPEVSFARFQGLIRQEYEQLVEEFGLIRMDATQTLIRQQRLMREIVRPHLNDIVKVSSGEVREALSSADLLGRYLEPASQVTL